MVRNLFEKIKNYNHDFDEERLMSALNFVKDRYDETEGNIEYPFRVLEILLPLRPDEESIMVVMLYDLYSRNLLSDSSVKEIFGNKVAAMLLSLKKLRNLKYEENDQASQLEVLRKMFLVMARDLRVILIWLALRICQMESLAYSDESKYNYKMAKETMEIHVPIAARLGIYRMKITLEDLSFKYLNTQEYDRIEKELKRLGDSDKLIEPMTQILERFFKSKQVNVEVSGRVKSIYSIYRKLQSKHLVLVDDLYDLFAMRVVINAPEGEDITDQLYLVLALLHSEWKTVSKKFKDYVSVPKPNGYMSLHTVVLGLYPRDNERPVEIQVRDSEMHRHAEYGVASHWLYKGASRSDKNIQSQVEWIRGLEKIHEHLDNEMQMVKEVEVNIFKDRIFVLTPRGEVKDLPLGSVPIDFAYSVHSALGNRCVTAKVNGNLVPLDYQLQNGDVIEVITSKDSSPKLDWLSIVKTKFAKHKIRAWFRQKMKHV